MLAKICQFVKKNTNNILLFLLIASAVLLAFGAGILAQRYLAKPAIEILEPSPATG